MPNDFRDPGQQADPSALNGTGRVNGTNGHDGLDDGPPRPSDVLDALRRIQATGYADADPLAELRRHYTSLLPRYTHLVMQDCLSFREAVAEMYMLGQHSGLDPVTISDMAAELLGNSLYAAGWQPPKEPPPPPPEIDVVAGQLAEIATRSEIALIAARRPIFQRANTLCRPVVSPAKVFDRAGKKRRVMTPSLMPLDAAAMTDELSQSAVFRRFDARRGTRRRGEWVPADPPHQIAATILSRAGGWRFAPIRGVVATPTLRPDGSVLQRPGFDDATGLFMFNTLSDMPPIAAHPSKDDAAHALALLSELLTGFPFVDGDETQGVDHAVALALLMTPTLRAAMDVSPLFVIDAPTPGTGKSYLLDTAAFIGTGGACAMTAAARDEVETEKQLNGLLLEARPFIGLDNINGELSSSLLSQAISQPQLSLRALGASRMFDVDNTFVICADGNNITVLGELTRRTIRCRMDAKMERPETRGFANDPHEMVRRNRAQYVHAILTIARAYCVSGANIRCTPLAGFDLWTEFVRAPLVWLDCADPAASVEAVRAEDPEALMLARLFGAIHEAVGGPYSFTAARLAELAGEMQWQVSALRHPNLQAVLAEQFGLPGGSINVRNLSRWLGRSAGRVVDGMTLRRLAMGARGGTLQYQIITK